MRSSQEIIHTPCEDVLDEIDTCDILWVMTSEDDNDLEDGEYGLCNSFSDTDPLILTRDELRRLGQQLIDLAGQ